MLPFPERRNDLTVISLLSEIYPVAVSLGTVERTVFPSFVKSVSPS